MLQLERVSQKCCFILGATVVVGLTQTRLCASEFRMSTRLKDLDWCYSPRHFPSMNDVNEKVSS